MRYFYDSTYLLLVPALILSLWAQFKVSSAYRKYKRIRTTNGYTGQQVARMMLDEAGLFDVPIEIVNTELGDHYDPRDRVLRLSREVYSGATVAAAGIAAHEVGHAIQHKEEYSPLIIRNSIAPIVNISSNFSWLLFFLGIFLGLTGLTTIGIVLFLAVVIFQLVTLPVEFNASSRALNILSSRGILYGEEIKGAKKVLQAAAMTYVAAAVTSIMQLIRLLAIARRND